MGCQRRKESKGYAWFLAECVSDKTSPGIERPYIQLNKALITSFAILLQSIRQGHYGIRNKISLF